MGIGIRWRIALVGVRVLGRIALLGVWVLGRVALLRRDILRVRVRCGCRRWCCGRSCSRSGCSLVLVIRVICNGVLVLTKC